MKALAMMTGMLLLVSCTGEAQTANAKPRTVVLELFTSQGCSSCPPADALLSKLQRENMKGITLIPLAYHVDYWNHLGWSDPFSSNRWSQRQNEYARVMNNDQLYTPQLVINGEEQFVGSSERPIRSAIQKQLDYDDIGNVSIERIARVGDKLQIDLRSQHAANVNLVVTLFENGVVTAVERGENANRKLTDDAIVRWQSVVKGNAVTVPLDAKWNAAKLGVAAFLQDQKSLEIFAGAVRNVE
jgi:hypothetical protein